MPSNKPKGSFTVWSYDFDAAPFHHNQLRDDTFERIDRAVRVARQRVRESNHNTGWAKIIDNQQAGHLGDHGVIAMCRKSNSGHARMTYRRQGPWFRAKKHAATNKASAF